MHRRPYDPVGHSTGGDRPDGDRPGCGCSCSLVTLLIQTVALILLCNIFGCEWSKRVTHGVVEFVRAEAGK